MKKLKTILPILTAFFISCEKGGVEGPNLNDLYGELTILENLEVVGDSANFELNEAMHFTASFSKIVDWKITITGLSSDAKKIISGKSNFISASNSKWSGGVTSLPFFKDEENCSVILTFQSHNDSLFKMVKINGAKTYGNGSELIITDFEGGFNPNFSPTFFNSGMIKRIEDVGPGEGNRFLAQESAPNGCPWDWLIGYVTYPSDQWLQQGVLSADPDNVYFNIMVKGDSTLSAPPNNTPNSLFKLEFFEDENQDNYWNQGDEDMLYYEFLVDWNGWRMISIKYSDLLASTDPNNGGGGNKIREPNRILKVRTLLLADPYDPLDLSSCSGFAKADVDYLIWSEGSPILNQ